MHEVKTGTRAIVIGAGLAGLCAARVLSRHFDRVTLIERDVLPDVPQHRKGVPQSHHGHGLLMRGLMELEGLFPGFEERLTAIGAQRVDLGSQFGHYSEWGWGGREPNGVRPIVASRLALENTVRALAISQIDNLELVQGTRVQDLLTEQRDGRWSAHGVQAQGPEGPVQLRADLVVDTSGKNGRLLRWLAARGLPLPHEEVVDAGSAYASRFYKAPTPRPPEWWWKGLLIDGKPPDERRWAMLLPEEGNRFVLMLGGVNWMEPPTEEEAYLEYLRQLRTTYLAEVIERCEPVSAIHGCRPLRNRWRHFESWRGQLDGFLCLGDELCTLNPLHGQGVTSAAVCSVRLDEALREVGTDPRALPPAFYKRAAKFLAVPWGLATRIDLQWPETVGHRSFIERLAWPIIRVIGRSIHEDAALQSTFGRVYHLLDPATVGLRPSVLWRIVYTAVRRGLRGPMLPLDHDPMRLPAEAGSGIPAQSRSLSVGP